MSVAVVVAVVVVAAGDATLMLWSRMSKGTTMEVGARHPKGHVAVTTKLSTPGLASTHATTGLTSLR
jgi:protein-S-isoprenylcysteine O-methyltransferase Ste14